MAPDTATLLIEVDLLPQLGFVERGVCSQGARVPRKGSPKSDVRRYTEAHQVSQRFLIVDSLNLTFRIRSRKVSVAPVTVIVYNRIRFIHQT